MLNKTTSWLMLYRVAMSVRRKNYMEDAHTPRGQNLEIFRLKT
jgi:hypothetical protein